MGGAAGAWGACRGRGCGGCATFTWLDSMLGPTHTDSTNVTSPGGDQPHQHGLCHQAPHRPRLRRPPDSEGDEGAGQRGVGSRPRRKPCSADHLQLPRHLHRVPAPGGGNSTSSTNVRCGYCTRIGGGPQALVVAAPVPAEGGTWPSLCLDFVLGAAFVHLAPNGSNLYRCPCPPNCTSRWCPTRSCAPTTATPGWR